MKEKLKVDSGITLVALVVTIVIMLILAGVSLNFILGDYGLLNKSKEGANKYSQQQVNEQNMLDDIDTWIDENLGSVVEIDQPIDWDAILADANSNPDKYLQMAKEKGQDIDNNSLIGIGTNGKIVNMNYFNCYLTKDDDYVDPGQWALGIYNSSYGTNQGGPCYNDSTIKDGKCVEKLPQYIYNENSKTFEPVKSMRKAFNDAPLVETPEIPTTVEDLTFAFSFCDSLKKVSTIPSSVTRMDRTFFADYNIEGTIVIHANPTAPFDSLFAATTKPITLTGSSTMLEEMAGTSPNGNITVKK